MDARKAAYLYLYECSSLLPENNKLKLLNASIKFKNMLDSLLTVVPYEKTSAVFNGSAKPVWDKQTRTKLASALNKVVVLEKEVRVIVRDILSNWE
jgi:hypothetical protein